jgi:hypothetical protein
MELMVQLKIKIPSPALKDQAGKGEVNAMKFIQMMWICPM